MEQYFNLKSPLNEQGVFVADASSGVDNSNPYMKNLPSMPNYLYDLRQPSIDLYMPSEYNYFPDMNLSFPELLK